MPLCRIEIEQTAADRWSVEVEAGHDWRFRCKRFVGTSFDNVIDQVIDAYREAVPVEPPKPPVVPSQPITPVENPFPTRVPRQRRQRRGQYGQML